MTGRDPALDGALLGDALGDLLLAHAQLAATRRLVRSLIFRVPVRALPDDQRDALLDALEPRP